MFFKRSSNRPLSSTKVAGVLAIFIALFFIKASPVSAITRYVNSDSSGAASNPTRPFDDPSYSPNNSYKTFSAAYTAAATGDTIELSGGTNGKSYPGHANTLQKASLTIQGSSISGHDGTVTIDYNGGNSTIGVNANGMTLQKLTVSRNGGTSGENAIRVYLDNTTVRNVTIANTNGLGVSIEATADSTSFENFYADTSTIQGTSAMIVFNAITMKNSLFSGIDSTGVAGISFQTNSGTSTLDNVVFDGVASGSILVKTGTTVNMTNCAITSSGFNYPRTIIFNSPATVNTNHCFIQGPLKDPHVITSGTGTWNSTNDIIGEYANYTRSKENFGYILLGIDDRHNIDHFKTLADYAKTNYGMTMSFYVHDTGHLSTNDKSKMQQLYLDGHEIAIHTKNHTNMSLTGPFDVTYSGSATNISFVISGSATSLSVTGSADTHGPIDLTDAASDTVGELCTVIDSWSNYTCTLTGTPNAPTRPFLPSNYLKDASTQVPKNVATRIIYDDNTGPTNRYMEGEVTDAITDVTNAMHENPATASYVAKSFGYPYSGKTDFTTTWIKNNTNLITIRGVGVDSLQEKSWLGNINLFAFHNVYTQSNITGPGYAALSTPDKKLRIEKAARSMITLASNGMATGYAGHNETQDFTIQEFEWLIDELAKYKDVSNVQIKTQAAMVEDIKNSGSWTDQGNGFWTRTFSEKANYYPRTESAMIDAGTTVAGRTTDIGGNPLFGTPDIGVYEFQVTTPTQTPSPTPSSTPTPTLTPTNTPVETGTPTPTQTPQSFPTTSTLDNFDRADGDIGSTWEVVFQPYVISNNSLFINTMSSPMALWKATFGTNQEVFTTYKSLASSSTELDLIMKVQAFNFNSSMIKVLYDPTDHEFQVWTNDAAGPGWQQRGSSISQTVSDGDVIGASASEQGTVTVYVNGNSIGSADITAWAYNEQGGYIGVWSIGTNGSSFDNFGGGSY
ncbi:MAG: hypothetical protein ABI425_00720 [Patescibacteria group bacterium]